MKNNIKILVIGFGSIGQRHYKNLLKLSYKNVWVYDLDLSKIGRGVKTIVKLNQQTLSDFTVAFICNPTSEHIKTTLKCAQADCYLFIEKPLAHNLVGVDELIEICREKKLINFVACNMRFHPAFQMIKKHLDNKKLGKIYSISHEFGYYLPYWRSGTDYRKNYAAKKSRGGGIVLDDIHEFDLMFWLNNFEPVKKSTLFKKNSGALEIETEDQAKAMFQFKNEVLGSVACNYLSKKYHRTCQIVGEKGNLSWDWNENIVWLENEKGRKKVFGKENYDLNDMYIKEVKYFLDSVNNKKKTFNDISRAKTLLTYLI